MPAIGTTNIPLEYEKYLPDFLSEITYPEKSKLLIFQPSKNKKVMYLAAYHTDDFNSIERQAIKKILTTERPDLCILEGIPTSEGLNPQWIIETAHNLYQKKVGGENTYAAYFCHQFNIPFIGGEIDHSLFFNKLLERGHSKKDIVFFMLLQQIPFWDRDNKIDVENQKKQFELFMHDAVASWFKVKIDYTLEEFLTWYQNHYRKAYNSIDFKWKEAQDQSWTDRRTGACMHQKIGADCMNIRDNHIILAIRRSLERYNKILVIFGAAPTGNHYVWQKEALESFLGTPNEIELTSVLE